MFDNIPAELQGLSQWVCWRYETKPDAIKPTKVPYNVSTGWPASSTDPATWTTFQNAVAASRSYDGIGFVLSENDPYCFIDLDTYDPTLTEEQRAEHVRIGEYFDGYIELSPSGKGYHLIVKGQVPAGRKRYGVEIYSSGRYMTMTGHVQRPGPIVDCQEQCDILWHDLSPEKAYVVTRVDQPQTQEDSTICQTAYDAINGQKFWALYQGEWNGFYKSQSEADFALVDILWFYTKNRKQVRRIFSTSKLYRAEKFGYHMDRMLDRASDNDSPPVDIEALKLAMAKYVTLPTPEAEPPPPAPMPEPAHDVYCVPQGLLGELAQYLYANAARQVPEIALCAAMALMAGICGRSYNINGTGLNHYLLLLAPTGSGKEAMASGISNLMTEVQKLVPAAMDFIGPGAIRSDAALLKYIAKRSPSFITIGGEFGHTMKQMAAINAPGNIVGIKQVMLDLYGKSGRGMTLRPTIYSDQDKNTNTLASPAFSFLGESAPESFFDAIDERLVSDGMLPRFTLIEYKGIQPPLNQNANIKPPSGLVQNLAAVCARSLQLNAAGNVIDVQYVPDAKTLLDAFEEFCRDKINSPDNREVIRHIWNRAHLRALKLAALYAVGLNPFDPVISVDAATWAVNLSSHNTTQLLKRFETGDIGIQTSDDKHIREVYRIIGKYLKSRYELIKLQSPYEVLHKDKIVPFIYVQRNTSNLSAFKNAKLGANQSLRSALKILCDNGELILLSKLEMHKRYGINAEGYAIGQVASFVR